eukprot:11228343-Lingulodinium_polyedra.AAC.1
MTLKYTALTSIIGIIFLNGCAGRSCEWQHMTAAHVKSQFDDNKDYLTCTKYKTFNTYGELAKWVAPGTIAAIKVFMSLPGKTSELLLDPPQKDAKLVSIAHYLRRFGARYLPKYQPPAVNLLRKMYHTKLYHSAQMGQCSALLSKVDAHSKEVAEKIYCTTTVEDDKKLGQILFEAVMDKPVAWPVLDKVRPKLASHSELHKWQTTIEEQVCSEQTGEDSDESDKEVLYNARAKHSSHMSDSTTDANPKEHLPLQYYTSDDGTDHQPHSHSASGATTSQPPSPSPATATHELSAPSTPTRRNRHSHSLSPGHETPPKQKRRRTLMSEEQKAWVIDANVRWCGSNMVGPKQKYKDMLQEGINAGILTPENSAEGLRSLIRSTSPRVMDMWPDDEH